MKISKLIKFVAFVVIGVVIVDIVFRLIFTPVFDNPPINTRAGGTYKFVTFKEPVEIAILGASKANRHYRSSQIMDSLGVSVYNYGSPGRCIFYQYLCLLRGIENGGLRTVILDLADAQLSEEWVNERISDLYPYYWKNDEVKKMVDEVDGEDMGVLMLSALVQFNSQYLNFVAPIVSDKGYTPFPYTGKVFDINKHKEDIEKNYSYSKIAIKYLKKIMSICKDNNIELIVCLSPSMIVSEESENYLLSLCSENGITCWDKTHFISDARLFYNANHLNEKGAELFTEEIVRMLKSNNI